MGTAGLLMLERCANRGRHRVGGRWWPGSSPRSPSIVFVHCGTSGRTAEFSSQGKGEGLPGSTCGRPAWGNRLAMWGPQSVRASTLTERSPLGFSTGHLRGPAPLCGWHQLPRPAPGPGGQLLVCGSLLIARLPRVAVAKGEAWGEVGMLGNVSSACSPHCPTGEGQPEHSGETLWKSVQRWSGVAPGLCGHQLSSGLTLPSPASVRSLGQLLGICVAPMGILMCFLLTMGPQCPWSHLAE